MGLRYAEIQAAYRKLQARRYDNLLTSATLHFQSSENLEIAMKIDIPPGVGIVTGGNGAGKTTLLKALQALDEDGAVNWPARLARAEMSGVAGGSVWAVEVMKSAGGEDLVIDTLEGDIPRFVFIDPAEDSQRIVALFSSDPNAADLLAGTDPNFFGQEWVEHASRILRRRYDFIKVTEIEGANGDGLSPWFEVSVLGTEYDTYSMGRGELSALFMLWRLSAVRKNSIVVIDEPESGLAAYSQTKLKETLVYLSAENGFHFILSTHSPGVYLGLPGDPVSIIESLPRPKSHGPMSSIAAAQHLGAPSEVKLAVFAEDQVACELVASIIRNMNSSLAAAVEVFASNNGESSLARFDNDFSTQIDPRRRLNLLTVYDGDQRMWSGGIRDARDQRAYLPGDDSPEEVLRKISEERTSRLSDDDLRSMGIMDPTAFRLSMSRNTGENHHDWFVEMSSGFQTYAATADILVRICMGDEAFKQDAERLLDEIQMSVS